MSIKKELLEMNLEIISKRISAFTHYMDYLEDENVSIELIIKLAYKIAEEFNLKIVGSGENKYSFKKPAPQKVFDDGYVITCTTVGDDISYNNTYDLVFAGKLTQKDENLLNDILNPSHFACEEDITGFFNYYYFGFNFTKEDNDDNP